LYVNTLAAKEGTATMAATRQDEIQLPQGRIRYREAGSGEPILFIHGFLVDSRLWDGTAAALSDDFRCIQPDWPMGSHRVALDPGADLSPPGVAKLVHDFIEALDLDRVTVVGNDSGGAISQILATRHPERIARLVLTNCDTHDNFPPAPFNLMPPIARLPGGMTALALPFRLGALRRASFRQFAKRPIPPEVIDSWMEPSTRDPGVKRDTRKLTAGMHKRYTLEAAEKLAGFDRPTLLAWAPGDRYFKLSYAERLAAAIPNARLETVEDSKTFVPHDQPERLAGLIREFIADTGKADRSREEVAQERSA
jgi:pimeloyl-ACP methyl ester carboxylesterase